MYSIKQQIQDQFRPKERVNSKFQKSIFSSLGSQEANFSSEFYLDVPEIELVTHLVQG